MRQSWVYLRHSLSTKSQLFIVFLSGANSVIDIARGILVAISYHKMHISLILLHDTRYTDLIYSAAAATSLAMIY